MPKPKNLCLIVPNFLFFTIKSFFTKKKQITAKFDVILKIVTFWKFFVFFGKMFFSVK